MKKLCVLILLLVGGVFSTTAQSSSAWSAEFFNDTTFSSSAATATYSQLDFNWSGIPAGGVNADNFSVRFTKSTYLAAGIYTYTLSSNGQATLTVNDVPILTVNNGSALQQIQVQSSGTLTLKLEFVHTTGTATLQLTEPTGVRPPSAPPVVPSDGRIGGLISEGAIYVNDDGIRVYGVDEHSNGYLALALTDMDEAAPEENTLLESNGNIALYRLTTGEYQVNIGPDESGNVRVVVFNAAGQVTSEYSFDALP